MRTYRESPAVLLELFYLVLLTVLEAQQLTVWPEVTGCLGHNVTLPCKFNGGAEGTVVSQVQWDLLLQPEGKNIIIILSDVQHGAYIHESPLKDRVQISEQSLIIKSVEMRDAGSYTCKVASFPSGSFEGTTKLIVLKQMPLSSGHTSAIVVAVLLLAGIVAAIVYLIFIRRGSSARLRVDIDTSGSVMDAPDGSPDESDETVVYSDVAVKPTRDAPQLRNDKPTETAPADDVVYARVIVLHKHPN